jgi:hypothetical protein
VIQRDHTRSTRKDPAFFWRTLVCFGTCVGEPQSIIVKKTVSGLPGDNAVRVCVTVVRSLKTVIIQDDRPWTPENSNNTTFPHENQIYLL